MINIYSKIFTISVSKAGMAAHTGLWSEHQYRPHRSVDSAISTTISTDSKSRAHRNLLIVESQSVVIAVSFKGRTEALIDYQNCPQSALIYQLTMGAPGHLYCIDSIELAMIGSNFSRSILIISV